MLLHSPAWCRIQIGTDTDVRYEPLSDRIPNRIASSAAQFNHILSVIAARRRDKTLLPIGIIERFSRGLDSAGGVHIVYQPG